MNEQQPVTTITIRETYFCNCGVYPPRISSENEMTVPNDGEPETALAISVSHSYLYFKFIARYVWRATKTFTVLNNGESSTVFEENPDFDAEVALNNELRAAAHGHE